MKQYPNKVLSSDGVVVHIDRSPEEEAEVGMVYVMMDHMLLSSADFLIISRYIYHRIIRRRSLWSAQHYRSNFGEIAAIRSFNKAFMKPKLCAIGRESVNFTEWFHVYPPSPPTTPKSPAIAFETGQSGETTPDAKSNSWFRLDRFKYLYSNNMMT